MSAIDSLGRVLWPCASPNKDVESGGTLTNRVCPHWRIAPGILCLVASIIAIACSLIWNTPSLCIAFAPAAACSTYMIYLGWDFQHLQTFAASNQELATQNGELRGNIGNLQSENERLTASNADLQRNVERVQSLHANVSQRASEQHARLEGLQGALTTLQHSAKGDHATFAANLELFIREVGNLQRTREQFDSTNSEVERRMQAQFETLLSTVNTLQGIFTAFSDWKNDQAVRERLEVLQQLQAQVTALTEERGNLHGQITALQEVAENMADHNTNLGEGIRRLLEIDTSMEQRVEGVIGRLEGMEGRQAGQAAELHE